MNSAIQVQILFGCLHSKYHANTLGKGTNPSILPPALAASQGEKNLNSNQLEVGNRSWGWPEGSLFDSYYQGVGEGAAPFPGLLHFTLDPYLIMLSVEQGDIKYHFLSLWYDSTWYWTQVSRAIGKHSNHHPNVDLLIWLSS